MAPVISAGFGATIFMLIKVVVHMRKNPAKWAVYTAPLWFMIAGTICTLSIVYKGSPNLGLNKKPKSYVSYNTSSHSTSIDLSRSLVLLSVLELPVLSWPPCSSSHMSTQSF